MRFRKRRSHNADPSFVFSTWPIPQWSGVHPFIRVEPSGGNDSVPIKKATDRLGAIGGALYFIEGIFLLSEPINLAKLPQGSVISGNIFRHWFEREL